MRQRRMSHTHLSEGENRPVWFFIVSDHADRISLIKATSVSGFSATTQFHTSIPEAIADGVATPNGRETR
jgi:hypothetical protein